MSIDYPTLRQHAYLLAVRELCTTSALSAGALRCSLDAARDGLRSLVADGYLRTGLLSGFGNQVVFQPTAKNLPTCRHVPTALRVNAPPAARLRALLRSAVCFRHHPELAYLTAREQAQLRQQYAIPERGYSAALVGLDGSHFHVFVTLDGEPEAGIVAAAARWLPLLDSGVGTLHPVVQATHIEPVKAVLAELSPTRGQDAAIRERIDTLRSEIDADPTGIAGVRHGAELRALEAELAASVHADLNWLGSPIGVQL